MSGPPTGWCPRCGITTHSSAARLPQPCNDCREVDPEYMRQWPTARQRAAMLREQRAREEALWGKV